MPTIAISATRSDRPNRISESQRDEIGDQPEMLIPKLRQAVAVDQECLAKMVVVDTD